MRYWQYLVAIDRDHDMTVPEHATILFRAIAGQDRRREARATRPVARPG